MFIGCTPFYGFHLTLCILVAWAFKLSQAKTYLAAHVSLPGVWPLLVLAELQVGRLLRGAPLLGLSLAQVKTLDPWRFSADLLLGSTAVGLALGAGSAWLTYRVVARMKARPEIEGLIEETARRYVPAGISHWGFVHGKLRHDPLYCGLLQRGSIPSGGTLLDLGCGRGIVLALLATARERAGRGLHPPGWQPPPGGLTLRGIEGRPKTAAAARTALGEEAEVETGDLTRAPLPPARTVLLLDVLHYLPAATQEALLDRAVAALETGGVLLVREADAAGRGAFRRTRAAERLCALARGDFRQRFHYRSADEWTRLLAARGLAVQAVPMAAGTPYANVLLEGRRT